MQSIKRLIFENKLFFGGIILTASNVLAGILGYCFQILWAVCSPLLNSVYWCHPVFRHVLRFAAKCFSPGHCTPGGVLGSAGVDNQLQSLIFRMSWTICTAVGLAFAYGALLPKIGALVNVDQEIHLWLFFIFMVFVALSSICNAVLQGLELFAHLSAVGITGVALKLIFAPLLVTSGFGLVGVIAAVALSSFLFDTPVVRLG